MFWGYPRRLMITHTIESYWIPSKKKTKSKLQNDKDLPKYLNFETDFIWSTPSKIAWYDVHIWNGSDEYCWRYRADTILSTDGQTGKVKPVYPPFPANEIRRYFVTTSLIGWVQARISPEPIQVPMKSNLPGTELLVLTTQSKWFQHIIAFLPFSIKHFDGM